jgi:hypothetical protein
MEALQGCCSHKYQNRLPAQVVVDGLRSKQRMMHVNSTWMILGDGAVRFLCLFVPNNW